MLRKTFERTYTTTTVYLMRQVNEGVRDERHILVGNLRYNQVRKLFPNTIIKSITHEKRKGKIHVNNISFEEEEQDD